MALSATIIWEVQNGGSDTNGGGYKSDAGTTDYSRQPAAQLALSDVACTTGGVVVTSVTGGFTAAMVGNVCYISGANFTTGWYEITAHTDSNTIEVDRDPTNGSDGSSGTLNVGGAFATFGQIGKVLADHGVSGMSAFVKYHATPYDIDSASYNVSGGAVQLANDRTYTITGYSTTREVGNNDADMPTIQVVGCVPDSAIDMLNTTDDQTQMIENLIFDSDDNNLSVVVEGHSFGSDAENIARRVNVYCSDVADIGFYGLIAIECKAYEAEDYGFQLCDTTSCYAEGCGGGFVNPVEASHCVAYDNGYGFQNCGRPKWCTAIGGAYGFGTTFGDASLAENCIAVGSSAYGFVAFGASRPWVLINCATGLVGARVDHVLHDIGKIELDDATDSDELNYFVDPSNGDWRLSSEAAAAKTTATYVPTSDNNQTQDIGAVQHADPTASSGGTPVFGGMVQRRA